MGVTATTAAEPEPPVDGIRAVELTGPTSDGLALPATLRVRAGAAPGGPAMVLVHGSGPGRREKYREEAEAFTRAGVTTLAYDKRTVSPRPGTTPHRCCAG